MSTNADVPPFTIHFPDARTRQAFLIWWARSSHLACAEIQASVQNEDAPYMYMRNDGDMCIFEWDQIPF